MPTATKQAPKKSAASKVPKKQASTSSNKKQAGQDAELEKLFIDEIRDIYWAEKHLVKTLPKIQKAASTPELQDAIGEHLEVTKQQVTKLEQVFEMLNQTPRAKKCDGMEGITKEGEGVIEDTEDGSTTRDVALILASQKIEHYEIATYGGLTQLAKTLGKDEVAEILAQILAEEKDADQKLTAIAEDNINYEASEEGDDGDGEAINEEEDDDDAEV